MNEHHAILDAWSAAEATGTEGVLATVVYVKGSAYRRPGARMLMLPDGKHLGSISGGCLEGDVAKKAWWLTDDKSPVLRVYDTTSEDDAIWEFGLGCNGVVKVLLERLDSKGARKARQFLEACRRERKRGVMATRLDPGGTGERVFFTMEDSPREPAAGLARHMSEALREGRSRTATLAGEEFFIEAIAPPLPLFIFGAGHDAIPLARIAKDLGWRVTVADGRPAYARAERFLEADQVAVLGVTEGLEKFAIGPDSAVVIMSHNYPQDRRLLKEALGLRLRYLGLLGPRARTDRMLSELGCKEFPSNLHAPIGLDLGAETPQEIALSIVAEIQATFEGRPAGKLSLRRGPIHRDYAAPAYNA